jgi:hypothetical protein
MDAVESLRTLNIVDPRPPTRPGTGSNRVADLTATGKDPNDFHLCDYVESGFNQCQTTNLRLDALSAILVDFLQPKAVLHHVVASVAPASPYLNLVGPFEIFLLDIKSAVYVGLPSVTYHFVLRKS